MGRISRKPIVSSDPIIAPVNEPKPNHKDKKISDVIVNFFKKGFFQIGKGAVFLKNLGVHILPESLASTLDPRRRFIRVILRAPKGKQKAILEQMLNEFYPQMDATKKDKLFNLVEKGARAYQLVGLISNQMRSSDNIETLKAFVKVSPEEQELFLSFSKSAIANGLNAEFKKNFFERFENLGDKDGKKAFQRVSELLTTVQGELSLEQKCNLINCVFKSTLHIPDSDWSEILRSAAPLLSIQISPYDKCLIIAALHEVPKDDRSVVVSTVDQMVQRMGRIRAFTPEKIYSLHIAVLAGIRIPNSEKEEITQIVAALEFEGLNFRNQVAMFEVLANTSKEHRQITADLFQELFTEMPNENCIRLLHELMVTVPIDQREEAVRLTKQLFTPGMYPGDKVDLFQNVCTVPVDQRAHYVEMRLQDRLAEVVPAAVLARQGTNVHDGKRDDKVKAALELFYTHQGKIGSKELKSAVVEFKQYLDNTPESKDKELAKNALSGAKVRGESFGPLLDEEKFSILGLLVSGSELVGRLWIYASGLKEPDQTNAKMSMISALKDSYLHGERVCNQGKTQRLVVGVLQGRLKGVNIELPITTTDAINSFFSIKANQEIEELQKLLRAANDFCDENSDVIRNEFIEKINDYAEAQGFK